MYLFSLSLDMDLFREGGGSAVDAGIVDTAEHQHLIVGFAAYTAGLAYFVHSVIYYYNKNKIHLSR